MLIMQLNRKLEMVNHQFSEGQIMTTEARVIANRLNAQKSTGPRTAEGKAAVAQNAVKHGLSAQCDVIRGEDQEEFEQYREEMFWELNPVGTMQSRLAERIVSLAWRLRRAERIQNEAFDALLTKETSSPLARLTRSLRGKEQDAGDSGGCDGDPALAQTVVRDFANSRVLDRLLMYERRIESSLYRTMNELQKLRHAQDQESSKGANVSKASRLRIAGGTPATRPPDNRGLMIDSAKQSQSPGGETVDPGSSKKGEETPYGVTTSAGDCAKQSQDGGVRSVPVRASPETQDVASLREGGTTEGNGAKQSQSMPGDGVHGTPYESGDANADNDPAEGGAPSAGECAKQSQQAAALKAIPRARPRVAYHYHTTARRIERKLAQGLCSGM
jgi:hypothetical protein